MPTTKVVQPIGADGLAVLPKTLPIHKGKAEALVPKAGASYISPFVGRLDDHGADGMSLIAEIRAIYDNYDFDTEILAASIRSPDHVTMAALAGSDCATLPPEVFAALFKHPLTERGLSQFLSDWAATGQSIL